MEEFAKRSNYVINIIETDLTMPNSLNDIGIYDNILINTIVWKKAIKYIKSHITDEGILFICGFGNKHKVDSKIRKQRLNPTKLILKI